MSTAICEQIEVSNVGPVESLTIEIPPEGGVVVLSGRNGCGKSSVLDGIENLVTKRGSVSVRDAADRAEIEGFGARLTVGRRAARSGELSVFGIEGRLDIADLVDPGIDNPEAADARRVKTLLLLSGTTADPSLFHDLVGGRERFERFTSASVKSDSDILALAGAIKRDFEKHARNFEEQANQQRVSAEAARRGCDGIDLAGEDDPTKLQGHLEDAIREQERLNSLCAECRRVTKLADAAQQSLGMAKQSYSGPTRHEASVVHGKALVELETAAAEVVRLRLELDAAEQNRSRAVGAAKLAEQTWQTAAQHEQQLAAWQQQIDAAATVTMPVDDQLTQVSDAVSAARTTIEQAGIVRRAKEQADAAARYQAKAKELQGYADKLRSAAAGTDDVLTSLVSKLGCPLRVEHGRLVTTTHRGTTCFADLSTGERCKLAIDVVVDSFPVSSKMQPIIVLRQELWEALDPLNREAVAAHAKARRVLVFTAEATGGEQITAEVFA